MSTAPDPVRRPNVTGPLISCLMLHFVLWATWLVNMIVAVPRYKRALADFGMKLPEVSMILLDLADVVAEFMPLVLGGVLIVLILDALIFAFLRGSLRLRSLSVVWAGLMVLIPLCLIAFTAWGILEPLAIIQERLEGGKL